MTEVFWDVIEKAREDAEGGTQEAFLKAVQVRLVDGFSAGEIADWKNIQQFYMKLADTEDLWREADRCGIYLSDDAFMDFRAWLVAQGKEAFSSVMRDPKTLALYVDAPEKADFELFTYVSHSIYSWKAFEETYGIDGGEQFKKKWLSECRGRTEQGLNWMLEDKFDIYKACQDKPLSEEEKETLKNEILGETENNKVKIVAVGAPGKLDGVVQDMYPDKETEYRKISAKIDSGYEWGSGISRGAAERFHREMDELFGGAGWERISPVSQNASPRYCKGESLLYCHPAEVSGPCEAGLVPEVIGLLEKAQTCTLVGVRDEGRVYDLSRNEYLAALEKVRPEIEKDLLQEYQERNIGSDSDKLERVMLKYRVLTLDDHSSSLASFQPYWKFTEKVFDELVEQGKIKEKEGRSIFRRQNYVTADLHYDFKIDGGLDHKFKMDVLDEQIKGAKAKGSGAGRNRGTDQNRDGNEPLR